jgi:hypothetical protein
MALFDATGVGRIAVLGTGTNGQLKIVSCNAAGTLTTLATTSTSAYYIPSNTMAIDLFVNYSTNGQVTLYIDGVSVADSGPNVNILTDSATNVSQFLLSSPTGPSVGFSANVFWSEIIIQDTSTLGMGLVTLPPQAAGNTQSWTGSVSNINELTLNTSASITTTANNAMSEWTVNTALPSGSWAIAAVVTEAVVSAGTSGPMHFEWVVRTSDGTDHVAGNVAPATGFGNYQNVWPVNPQTGTAWQAGQLINIGIESLA